MNPPLPIAQINNRLIVLKQQNKKNRTNFKTPPPLPSNSFCVDVRNVWSLCLVIKTLKSISFIYYISVCQNSSVWLIDSIWTKIILREKSHTQANWSHCPQKQWQIFWKTVVSVSFFNIKRISSKKSKWIINFLLKHRILQSNQWRTFWNVTRENYISLADGQVRVWMLY